MKTFTLLVFFLLPIFIFPQTIDWIKTTGDILNDFGNYVQTDSAGNIYTSGIAQSTYNLLKTNHLATGVYVLTLRMGGESINEKIVIN